MSEPSEVYIYLGCRSFVHFFMHTVCGQLPDDTLMELAGGIYGCLIHEERLQMNEKVVVFNIRAAGILPVCVNHAAFATIEFPAGSLESTFRDLFAVDRSADNTVLSIEAKLAQGKPSAYYSYEVPMAGDLRQTLVQGRDMPIPQLQPMRFVASIKPIPYLGLA